MYVHICTCIYRYSTIQYLRFSLFSFLFFSFSLSLVSFFFRFFSSIVIFYRWSSTTIGFAISSFTYHS